MSLQNKVKAYIKLGKLGVVSLLDLAAIAGAILAYKIGMSILPIVFVIIGGTLGSMGAMIINSGIEIDRDKVMSRTSRRPTVVGYVSKKEAILVGSLLALIGSLIGFVDNIMTAIFIALGVIIYVFVYTILLKPRTWLNIVIGGFAGSAAAWAGYASLTNSFNLESFLLGFLIFMWTPGHFWSLALKYREDYLNAHYPMLPAVVGITTSAKAIAISNALMVPIVILLFTYLGLGYLIASTILSLILLFFSYRLMRNPSKEEAMRSFIFSNIYLTIIFLIIIISRLI
ncbi:protoheme IX farnesyltransferase [Sulfolobus sp. A20]|uniref:heme o synthase n=2 Tax=Sulfolobaceae TaxID=118883 RepID=UPI0008461E36|nr:heme o synthase [Sulfolobus sp. A20]TRM75640.1 protoheme IX farnesyltransferase [Sulfolobus sp. A20-N-F8]TRM79148.1 protoheme IX farnesyltransferase [Sulfolobus sp. B5]TRM88423.1 protoheme IX farnesyltransferase [Sulfolobus sp. E3]TRM89257.1 protoheme IX farnesyltransferase [Sulfolobus sp. C3]TRM94486.1 protoheme IX farnesyltransferase [Sulfolobus sp. A20-N-G8]TRM96623.1 protoheme IX farnesyltransferase [Sulfolobus sp. F1]TRN02539.1 protoheme IX farnesyltransferase [Sulfolobus sp. E1]